jgi:hypothetical protein
VLISAREAAEELHAVGVHRRQARRVLAAGFAGRAIETAAALLFEDARVRELAAWPTVAEARLDDTCPWGLFIARRDVDLYAPRTEQVDAVRAGWDLSPYSRVLIRVRIAQHGQLPFVAAVSGFVALGAEICDVLIDGAGRTTLVLGDPGPWFDELRGRRLAIGPGNAWLIRGGRRPRSPMTDGLGGAPSVGELGTPIPRPPRQETA